MCQGLWKAQGPQKNLFQIPKSLWANGNTIPTHHEGATEDTYNINGNGRGGGGGGKVFPGHRKQAEQGGKLEEEMKEKAEGGGWVL